MEGSHHRARRLRAPERFDQAVRRGSLAGVNDEERERGPLLRPRKRYRAAVDERFDRPEYADLDPRSPLSYTPGAGRVNAVSAGGDGGPRLPAQRRSSRAGGPIPARLRCEGCRVAYLPMTKVRPVSSEVLYLASPAGNDALRAYDPGLRVSLMFADAFPVASVVPTAL